MMIDRGQAPLVVGPHAQPLPRRCAMPDRAVHLLTPQHELDRLANELRGHDTEDLGTSHQPLGAEAAAEERTADVDLLRRHAEQLGDASARQEQALGRHVDRQIVTVPRDYDRMRLHGVVILRRRFVSYLDPLLGRGKARLDIAALIFRGVTDADDGRHKAFAGVEADARGQRLVTRRQQRRAFGRRLKRLRDHDRDGLVGVADLIALQHFHPEHERIGLDLGIDREWRLVARGHDIDDAGMAPGGGDIERDHTAARDAGDRHHGKQHAGRMIVGGVGRLPLDLEDAVAAGQRLADVRAVPQVRGSGSETELRHGGLRKSRQRERPATRACALVFRPRQVSARARRCGARARS